jgi:hypothetical protein
MGHWQRRWPLASVAETETSTLLDYIHHITRATTTNLPGRSTNACNVNTVGSALVLHTFFR